MLKRFQGLLAVALTSAGVDPKALLRDEPRQEPEVELRSDQRRLANIMAREKRSRKRRSSFTRELLASDEEPTLLDPNLLRNNDEADQPAEEGGTSGEFTA